MLQTSLVYSKSQPINLLYPSVSSNSKFNFSNSPLKYLDAEKTKMSNVVIVEGASLQNLFNNANIWVNSFFKNPKVVIQSSDSNTGILTLKCRIGEATGDVQSYVDFSLIFQFKDGRYKWEISSLIQTIDCRGLDGYTLYRNSLRESSICNTENEGGQECCAEIKMYIDSFTKAIESKDNDW